ncbi:MAG: T9SS type A sorting domain-containing protein [Flavobacteriales bacterium]|nr:T9SS type A sorting domain-containing protein [Flavobacteriales bacterium]
MHTTWNIIRFSQFIFVPTLLNAQVAPTIDWNRALGGMNADQHGTVIATSDGGALVASALQINGPDFDWLVTKLDEDGNTQWEHAFGGTNQDWPYSAVEAMDGAFLVLGFTESLNGDVTGNHGGQDMWLMKMDANGNVIWTRCYGGPGSDRGQMIIRDDADGFWLLGSSGSIGGQVTSNHGSSDVWLIRINNSGDLIWQQSYGGSGFDRGIDLVRTVDAGLLVASVTNSNDGDVSVIFGGFDIWILKLSATGSIDWQQTFGGSDSDTPQNVLITADNGCIITAQTLSTDGHVSQSFGSFDYWLLRLDNSGNLLWERSYGGSQGDSLPFTKMTSTSDLLVAGTSGSSDGDVSSNAGAGDIWVVKLAGNGDILWERSYGGSAQDFGGKCDIAVDGGLLFTSTSLSTDGDITAPVTSMGSFVWVVKLLPDLSPVPEHALGPNLQLYPNPTADELVIAPQLARTDQALIELVDAQGRLVRTLHDGLLAVDAAPIRIALGGLAPGSYGVRITAHDQRFTRYVVKV